MNRVSQRVKSWLCTELEMRDRALQEDRTKNYQEIEELKKMCCTDADRAKQLGIDEIATQEEESKSTVSQLMVQIQEVQGKVNSLNDTTEFYHPETASSSGLFHVPTQRMSIPSHHGLISRDSCMQPDTRNLCCTSKKRFSRLTCSR